MRGLFTASSSTRDLRQSLIDPIVFYDSTTSPEETTSLKIADEYHTQRYYTIRCTRRHVVICSLVFLLVLVSCCLSFLLYVRHTPSPCTSTSCVRAASSLLSRMDLSADPCDDFFRFACGGWVNRTRRKGETQWHSLADIGTETYSRIQDAIEKVIKKQTAIQLNAGDELAIHVYTNCMKAENDEEVRMRSFRRTFEEMGGWPLDDPEAKSPPIEEVILRAYRFATFPVFWLGTNVDEMDTSKYSMTLEEQLPFLASHSYYVQPGNEMLSSEAILRGDHSATIGILKRMAFYMAELAGFELTPIVQKSIADMIEFEFKLVLISSAFNQTATARDKYEKISIYELRRRMPAVDWLPLMERLFGRTIASSEMISVRSGNEWMVNLNTLIDEYRYSDSGKRIVANYITWKTLFITLMYAGKPSGKVDQNFLTIFSLYAPLDRPNFCLQRTAQILPLSMTSIGRKIVGQELVDENRKTMNFVSSKVKKSFEKTLQHSSVLDDQSRLAVLDKLSNLRIRNSFPEAVYIDEIVNRELNLVANYSADFPTLMVDALTEGLIQMRNLVNKPLRKDVWPPDTSNYILNVYYNFETNSVLFPFILAFDPFVDSRYPSFFNYGGYGAVIGHELNHAFDERGRLYGATGAFDKAWTREAENRYAEKMQCFVDQYATLSGSVDRSKKTVAENIGDNVGLEAAFAAWREDDSMGSATLPGVDLTPTQAFFTTYAQHWCTLSTKDAANGVHAHDEYRVTGPLQNSPEFAAAFKCPANSPMNPPNKCKMW